ncbi:hypothetical protein [Granulicella sp. dw_53]|uniref:hypothetical protein n=1 Tax=Granulicella sp. dw_53 TaxID=2719792 RepID=UPI001BD22472|nr:hypothetical protein [Granulicella sp. dw_53]
MPIKRTVFYSWQSDIDSRFCRNFIQDSLERALKKIGRDSKTDLSPVLDRDTSGLSGTPSIVDSIFHKIASSDIFVADITLINVRPVVSAFGFEISRPNRQVKRSPNPNVLVELGFAITHIGWDRIILIQNVAFGSPNDLPFDLRGRRVLTFTLSSGSKEKKSEVKETLTRQLDQALRMSLDPLEALWTKPGRWEPRWWGFWTSGNATSSYGGRLFIREVGSKGFFFHLDVHNGAHLGSVAGFAEFASLYTAEAKLVASHSTEICRIHFRRNETEPMKIEVAEISGCRHWHGMGTSFTNTFEREADPLFDLGFFDELDLQRLYSITGQHFESLMLRFGGTGETEWKEIFEGKAIFGLVRGLATIMEAIVMRSSTGSLWAAYIDDDVVRYFTTEPASRTKLPATIEHWRSGFSDKPIVFDSPVSIIPGFR